MSSEAPALTSPDDVTAAIFADPADPAPTPGDPADVPAGLPVVATPPRPGELTFAAPRRAKPPRHLADLTLAERKKALSELGHQGFRAAQISQHYFGHLTADPADWSDVPAAKRDELARLLTPRLLTPVSGAEEVPP